MIAPEGKVCRPHPAFPKLTNLGGIILVHLMHKYNIGHKTREETLIKNVSNCLIEKSNIDIFFYFPHSI